MSTTVDALPYHEAADIFPMMAADEFEGLKADILACGVLEPVVLCDGKILDGRNRYRACLELGVEPDFRVYKGDDPIGFVVSLNLHRRHLNTSQRAMVAARVANLSEGRPSKTAQIQAVSQEEAAERLNVSRASVQTAKQVIDAGVPELARAVDRGEVKVSAAAAVAELPPEEQREVEAVGPAAIREVARAARESTRADPPAPIPLPGQASFIEGEREGYAPAPPLALASKGTPEDWAAKWMGQMEKLRSDIRETCISVERRGGWEGLSAKWPSHSVRAMVNHLKDLRDVIGDGIDTLEKHCASSEPAA